MTLDPIPPIDPDTIVSQRRGGGVVARPAGTRMRWSVELRRAFLDHLAATANVKRSAEAVNVTPAMAYKLRQRDANFTADWAAALREAYHALELDVLDKALNGEERVVRSAEGERTIIKQDTGLQLRLLAYHRAAVKDAPPAPPRSEETAKAARKRMARELALIAERLDLSAALFPDESADGAGDGEPRISPDATPSDAAARA